MKLKNILTGAGIIIAIMAAVYFLKGCNGEETITLPLDDYNLMVESARGDSLQILNLQDSLSLCASDVLNVSIELDDISNKLDSIKRKIRKIRTYENSPKNHIISADSITTNIPEFLKRRTGRSQ